MRFLLGLKASNNMLLEECKLEYSEFIGYHDSSIRGLERSQSNRMLATDIATV